MSKGYLVEEASLGRFAETILREIGDCPIWLLTGEMGSGKTTLVRHLCENLDGQGEASSPSYNLIQEYHFGPNVYGKGLMIHMDLFRLKNLQEARELGIEEWLDSGEWCVIEWPGLILPLLGGRKIAEIHLEKSGELRRNYEIKITEL